MLAVPAASARAPADVQPAVTAEARGSAAPAPTQKSIYESIKPRPEPVGGSGNSPPGSEYRSYNPVPAAPAPPPPSQKPHSDPSPDSQYGFGNLKLEENVDQSRVAARKQMAAVNTAPASQSGSAATRLAPQGGDGQQTAPIEPVNMDTGTDREQRRLLRVRRELEKIQEMNEEEAVRKEQEKQEQHDLMEFAENYFNDQERCPSE